MLELRRPKVRKRNLPQRQWHAILSRQALFRKMPTRLLPEEPLVKTPTALFLRGIIRSKRGRIRVVEATVRRPVKDQTGHGYVSALHCPEIRDDVFAVVGASAGQAVELAEELVRIALADKNVRWIVRRRCVRARPNRYRALVPRSRRAH